METEDTFDSYDDKDDNDDWVEKANSAREDGAEDAERGVYDPYDIDDPYDRFIYDESYRATQREIDREERRVDEILRDKSSSSEQYDIKSYSNAKDRYIDYAISFIFRVILIGGFFYSLSTIGYYSVHILTFEVGGIVSVLWLAISILLAVLHKSDREVSSKLQLIFISSIVISVSLFLTFVLDEPQPPVVSSLLYIAGLFFFLSLLTSFIVRVLKIKRGPKSIYAKEGIRRYIGNWFRKFDYSILLFLIFIGLAIVATRMYAHSVSVPVHGVWILEKECVGDFHCDWRQASKGESYNISFQSDGYTLLQRDITEGYTQGIAEEDGTYSYIGKDKIFLDLHRKLYTEPFPMRGEWNIVINDTEMTMESNGIVSVWRKCESCKIL